jgi:ribosome-binding protein aMBF1 (putative translation factor)
MLSNLKCFITKAQRGERLSRMKQKTNFDVYLEEQLRDKEFAKRFRKAGEAWDVAIQLARLRRKTGLSQKELAKRVGTSQQQISRLESPSYEGHTLSMLRRVAEVLGAKVRVEIHKEKYPRREEVNHESSRKEMA